MHSRGADSSALTVLPPHAHLASDTIQNQLTAIGNPRFVGTVALSVEKLFQRTSDFLNGLRIRQNDGLIIIQTWRQSLTKPVFAASSIAREDGAAVQLGMPIGRAAELAIRNDDGKPITASVRTPIWHLEVEPDTRQAPSELHINTMFEPLPARVVLGGKMKTSVHNLSHQPHFGCVQLPIADDWIVEALVVHLMPSDILVLVFYFRRKFGTFLRGCDGLCELAPGRVLEST